MVATVLWHVRPHSFDLTGWGWVFSLVVLGALIEIAATVKNGRG